MLHLGPGPARLAGSSSRSTESEWKLRGRRRAWLGLGSHEEKISTPQCPAAAGSSQLSARMRDLMGVVVGWVRGAWCTDDVKSSAFRNG